MCDKEELTDATMRVLQDKISNGIDTRYRLANYFFLKLHFCVKLNKTIK